MHSLLALHARCGRDARVPGNSDFVTRFFVPAHAISAQSRMLHMDGMLVIEACRRPRTTWLTHPAHRMCLVGHTGRWILRDGGLVFSSVAHGWRRFSVAWKDMMVIRLGTPRIGA